MWTGIKSIISIKNSQVNVINKLKDKNGNITTDSVTMATILNDFFVNVADSVTKRIPRSLKPLLDYLDNENPNSFFITPTAPLEIVDIIDVLKTDKSLGPNSIPIKLLKILSLHTSSPLSQIKNESFLSGIFLRKCSMQKLFHYLKKAVL